MLKTILLIFPTLNYTTIFSFLTIEIVNSSSLNSKFQAFGIFQASTSHKSMTSCTFEENIIFNCLYWPIALILSFKFPFYNHSAKKKNFAELWNGTNHLERCTDLHALDKFDSTKTKIDDLNSSISLKIFNFQIMMLTEKCILIPFIQNLSKVLKGPINPKIISNTITFKCKPLTTLNKP